MTSNNSEWMRDRVPVGVTLDVHRPLTVLKLDLVAATGRGYTLSDAIRFALASVDLNVAAEMGSLSDLGQDIAESRVARLAAVGEHRRYFVPARDMSPVPRGRPFVRRKNQ